MERDQITEVLEDVGAVVLANACGPCIGQVHSSLLDKVCHSIHVLYSSLQWKREDTKDGANGGRCFAS